jgi:hypothetical protein
MVTDREDGLDSLKELLHLFQEKLADVQAMIAAYEEGMDYASHCALQGFAEGLAFAVDELKARVNSAGDCTTC